jgi:signal transduction histidine kinase
LLDVSRTAGVGLNLRRLRAAKGLTLDRLASMSERLRLVGGGLRIDSRPGGGTMIEAWLPPVQPRGGASSVPDPFPT